MQFRFSFSFFWFHVFIFIKLIDKKNIDEQISWVNIADYNHMCCVHIHMNTSVCSFISINVKASRSHRREIVHETQAIQSAFKKESLLI